MIVNGEKILFERRFGFVVTILALLCLALAVVMASPSLAHAETGDLVGYAYIHVGGGAGQGKNAVVLRSPDAVLTDDECKEMGYSPKNAVREGEDIPWLRAESSADEFRIEVENPDDTIKVGSMDGWFQGWNGLRSVDLAHLDTSRVRDMSYMFYNCSSLSSLDLKGFDTLSVTDMSYMFYNCSSLSSLDLSGLNTSQVVDMSYMFGNCKKLSSLSLSGIDTANVTDMSNMFSGCENLTSLDVSDFNTTRVTDVSRMFRGCGKLNNLDLSGLDTSKVVDMSEMFAACSSLKSLNLTSFDTSNVASMQYMFRACFSLSELNVSSFNTENVEDMSWMFAECGWLTSLDLSNFSTPKLADTHFMFHNCKRLTNLDLSSFDTSRVKDMSDMFLLFYEESQFDPNHLPFQKLRLGEKFVLAPRGDTGLDLLKNVCWVPEDDDSVICYTIDDMADFVSERHGVVTFVRENKEFSFDEISEGVGPRSCGSCTWSIDSHGHMVISPSEGSHGTLNWGNGMPPWHEYARFITSVSIEGSVDADDCRSMFRGCSSLVSLDLGGLDTSRVADMSRMFYGCSSLESLDISGFNAANVTNMSRMFYGCSKIGSLDFDGFDTSNVTDMSCMFRGCSSLASLNLEGLDTSKVVDMSHMFYGCSSLGALDVSNLSASRATDMSGMFYGCSELHSLDLKDLDASSVTDMSSMFYRCGKLTSVDLSGLNASSATDMSRMFYECSSLNSLSLEGLDTSSATDMSSMFYGCSSLVSLDASDFDTSHVIDMTWMFRSCTKLSSLDVSGFNTSSVKNLSNMFYACGALNSLDVSGFDTSSATDTSSMFDGCRNLPELDVSGFNTSRVTNMSSMFSGCKKLKDLDLSSFSTVGCKRLSGLLEGCDSLIEVRVGADCALHRARGNGLPGGLWRSSADERLHRLDEASLGVAATYNKVSKSDSDMRATLSAEGLLTIRPAGLSDTENDGSYSIFDYGYSSPEDVPWHDRSNEIKNVVVEEGCAPYGCGYWFNGCSNLETVDLHELDASRAGSFAGMFEGCSSLNSVIPSSTFTRNATDFSSMFRGCGSLEFLDLTCLDTSYADSMKRMFHGCRKLATITLGESFSFFGAGNRRLPGSELPDGAWLLAGSESAYASDSIPNFAAGEWRKLSDEELAAGGVAVVSVKAESEEGDPLLTVASEVEVEGGEAVEHLSYEVTEGFGEEVLPVGDEPVRASANMKTLNGTKAVLDKVSFKKKDGTADKSIKVVKVGPRVTRVASGAFRGAPDVVTLAFPDMRNVAAVAGCAAGSGLKYVRVKGTSANKGLLGSGCKKRKLLVAFTNERNGSGSPLKFKYYKDDKELPRG